jgi:hypothetical protein
VRRSVRSAAVPFSSACQSCGSLLSAAASALRAARLESSLATCGVRQLRRSGSVEQTRPRVQSDGRRQHEHLHEVVLAQRPAVHPQLGRELRVGTQDGSDSQQVRSI